MCRARGRHSKAEESEPKAAATPKRERSTSQGKAEGNSIHSLCAFNVYLKTAVVSCIVFFYLFAVEYKMLILSADRKCPGKIYLYF
jgi:hypothetical protein